MKIVEGHDRRFTGKIANLGLGGVREWVCSCGRVGIGNGDWNSHLVTERKKARVRRTG